MLPSKLLERRSVMKSSKKFRKTFYSCGDLRIYPIREIRNGNRIIYGDKYDVFYNKGNNQEEAATIYNLIPTQTVYSEIAEIEPVYSEIRSSQSYEYLSHVDTIENMRCELGCQSCQSNVYEKLYHWSSYQHQYPSDIISDSSDSGYRSISINHHVRKGK